MSTCNKTLRKCVYYHIHLTKKLLLSKHYFAKLLDLLVRIALQLILTFVTSMLLHQTETRTYVPLRCRTNTFYDEKAIDYRVQFFHLNIFHDSDVAFAKGPRGAFTCGDLREADLEEDTRIFRGWLKYTLGISDIACWLCNTARRRALTSFRRRRRASIMKFRS